MVSQIVKEKNSYQGDFRELYERQYATDVSWVKQLRLMALERFEQRGFPTTDEEEWKYTNVAPIARTRFETAPEPGFGHFNLDAEKLSAYSYEEAKESRLVFFDGIYRPELSSLDGLPEGVTVMDLNDALRDVRYAGLLKERLSRNADYHDNAFTALNTAFLGSGAFVFLSKAVSVAPPIHLLFVSGSTGTAFVSFPRTFVFAERDSNATIIEDYVGTQGPAPENLYWTNAVVEIVLEEGAHLEHYKVQRESLSSFHVATTKAELGRNSSYNSTAITLGAQLSRHNITVTFAGEGAQCRVDGLYLVTTGQHSDTHSLIEHRQPHCTSRQLYKGILDGKSRAVFNGKVFVHEGAQATDAQQTNRNLLLSNEARVDTKPQLEIFADDVKCAHGATVGQLEEEELFYLISRGLHPDLARNLLTYGFAEEVIEKIKLESIKAQLDSAVLNRLRARLDT